MYCRLEVEDTELEDVSDDGEPNCDIETSNAQCTSFLGVSDILYIQRFEPKKTRTGSEQVT